MVEFKFVLCIINEKFNVLIFGESNIVDLIFVKGK